MRVLCSDPRKMQIHPPQSALPHAETETSRRRWGCSERPRPGYPAPNISFKSHGTQRRGKTHSVTVLVTAGRHVAAGAVLVDWDRHCAIVSRHSSIIHCHSDVQTGTSKQFNPSSWSLPELQQEMAWLLPHFCSSALMPGAPPVAPSPMGVAMATAAAVARKERTSWKCIVK
jgi:hypothetical protein